MGQDIYRNIGVGVKLCFVSYIYILCGCLSQFEIKMMENVMSVGVSVLWEKKKLLET